MVEDAHSSHNSDTTTSASTAQARQSFRVFRTNHLVQSSCSRCSRSSPTSTAVTADLFRISPDGRFSRCCHSRQYAEQTQTEHSWRATTSLAHHSSGWKLASRTRRSQWSLQPIQWIDLTVLFTSRGSASGSRERASRVHHLHGNKASKGPGPSV